MFRQLKLSTQLIILFGLVIILSVILSTSLALFRQSQEMRRNLEDRGQILVDLTADFLITPLYFNDVANVRELLNKLVQNEGVTFAVTKNTSGIIIEAGNTEVIPDGVLDRVAVAAQQQKSTILIDISEQLLVAIPVERESVNAGTLIIGLSLETVQSQLQTTAIQLLITSLGWIVLGLAGTVIVARYLTKPIYNLTEAAQAISQGSYNISLPAASSQELIDLSAAFEQMAIQLQNLVETLETQVAIRTQRLEIVAKFGERLSAIHDVEQLSAEVVNQIQENFGYYYTHIYLFDEVQENLVVAAGTGEAGAKMKAKRHSIPLNTPTSLVARAAQSKEIIAVDNVRQTEDWLVNPLLPDTYSEMAVPIMLGGEDQVVGVLDVQEDKIGGLDESDANVLRSLANQVGGAIRNARLFQEVETALAQTQAVQEQYIEQAWQKMTTDQDKPQHHHTHPNAPTLKDTTIVEANKMANTHSRATVVTLANNKADESRSIVAPVMFRDQNIGALQIHPADSNDTWSDDDLAIVEAVLDRLAQTAENLRLFNETRQRAGQEQTLREITDKMRAAISLEELVKTTAEELGERLSVGHAIIELGVDERSAQTQTTVSPNGEDQIFLPPGIERKDMR